MLDAIPSRLRTTIKTHLRWVCVGIIDGVTMGVGMTTVFWIFEDEPWLPLLPFSVTLCVALFAPLTYWRLWRASWKAETKSKAAGVRQGDIDSSKTDPLPAAVLLALAVYDLLPSLRRRRGTAARRGEHRAGWGVAARSGLFAE